MYGSSSSAENRARCIRVRCSARAARRRSVGPELAGWSASAGATGDGTKEDRATLLRPEERSHVRSSHRAMALRLDRRGAVRELNRVCGCSAYGAAGGDALVDLRREQFDYAHGRHLERPARDGAATHRDDHLCADRRGGRGSSRIRAAGRGAADHQRRGSGKSRRGPGCGRDLEHDGRSRPWAWGTFPRAGELHLQPAAADAWNRCGRRR
jgi:hypothetical protein